MLPTRQPSSLTDLSAFLGPKQSLEKLADIHYSPSTSGSGVMRVVELVFHAIFGDHFFESQSLHKRQDIRRDITTLHNKLLEFANHTDVPLDVELSDGKTYQLSSIAGSEDGAVFELKLPGTEHSLRFTGTPQDLITSIHQHVLNNAFSYVNDDSCAQTRSLAHELIKCALLDKKIAHAVRQSAIDEFERRSRGSYASNFLSMLRKNRGNQFGLRLNQQQEKLAEKISSQILKINFNKNTHNDLVKSAVDLSIWGSEARGLVLNTVKLKLAESGRSQWETSIDASLISFLNARAVKNKFIALISDTPASKFSSQPFKDRRIQFRSATTC